MKKISNIVMITLLVSTVTMYAFKIGAQSNVKGWFLAGSKPDAYEIGVEQDVQRGSKVGYMKSVKNKIEDNGFGTIMQQFVPGEYLGKRVKLSGYVKSKDVSDWAGVWMRVDGAKGKTLSFDNMQRRPIKGTTEWTKYEIVLDVPEKSELIAFGVLEIGTGMVWLDDFKFEIVEKSAKTTNMKEAHLDNPTNINFEETIDN